MGEGDVGHSGIIFRYQGYGAAMRVKEKLQLMCNRAWDLGYTSTRKTPHSTKEMLTKVLQYETRKGYIKYIRAAYLAGRFAKEMGE